MANGVGNRNDILMSSADFGGQKLLGIPSLTNYINNGYVNVDESVQNDKFQKELVCATKPRKKNIPIPSIASLIAIGVSIAYILKTGKIDYIKKKLPELGKSISKFTKENWGKFLKLFKKGS